MATSLPVTGSPPAFAAFSTDPEIEPFTPSHLVNLRQLFDVDDVYDVAGVHERLQSASSNIVYFLCHLVFDRSAPALVVGPLGGESIQALTLFDWNLDLCPGHPLVFLNACNSAAASPESLFGLVDEFFGYGASAAVGTEITVFVDMAIAFAELLLGRLLASECLGSAIRQARIALLGMHNPLGLAYVAFGLPQLELMQATGA